jgi:hypothetical protein
MSDWTCPKCGEEVSMMGHAPDSPCPGRLSEKATELGRLRILLTRQMICPFCEVGYWRVTGTAGRLACATCGSIALDGRRAEARRILEGEKVP